MAGDGSWRVSGSKSGAGRLGAIGSSPGAPLATAAPSGQSRTLPRAMVLSMLNWPPLAVA